MLTFEEHLDNLVRHIDLVRDACLSLGKKLIGRGQKELGRLVIARGQCHDISKFEGIEWQYLHAGKDVPRDKLDMAISHHASTNDHHPEHWAGLGGIEKMPDDCVAEMVCDWRARSQEFGTGLRDWIKNVAMDKYKIEHDSDISKMIDDYVNLLLEDHFAK